MSDGDARVQRMQSELAQFLMRWVQRHRVRGPEAVAALALELAHLAHGNDVDPNAVLFAFLDCHNRCFPRHAIACNVEEPPAGRAGHEPGCELPDDHAGPCADECGRIGPLLLLLESKVQT